MATDNNIKNFTATDIEKYHKGLLSAKERHDLEKAALDDPFLADALEGYSVAGVNAAADMNELKERLAQKTATGKMIAMKTGGRSSFRWLRAAAIIILIAGAGLLAKQFVFTSKTKDIAQADSRKMEATKTADSAAAGITSSTPTTENKPVAIAGLPQKEKEKPISPTEKITAPGGSASKDESKNVTVMTGKINNDVTVANTNGAQPVVTAPIKVSDEESKFFKADDKMAGKKEIVREERKNNAANPTKQELDKDGLKDQVGQQGEDLKTNRAVTTSRQANDQYRNNTTNIFRGRVTDSSNVGVPFANVTNVQDNNAGTYTDARGFFNLTYPDSILNVQVRSIGFENTNVQLRNSVPNNQVVMQDDRRSLSEVVISNQKPNAAVRSRDNNNVKLEEPEPADGWDNYDAYLANNLNAPEEIRTKQNAGGDVQVSFEVDKNGEPTNIKIEKSLCSKCDKEAIRLVKEGPRWKRNAKKGRTTVTISFSNTLQ